MQPKCILDRLHEWQQVPNKFNQLGPEGAAILDRVSPLICSAWNNRGTDNLRNLIEQLWIDLGGPATLLNQRDIHDIRNYFDLLETWQQAGTLKDWEEFSHAVDHL